jgi:hypothetical protein
MSDYTRLRPQSPLGCDSSKRGQHVKPHRGPSFSHVRTALGSQGMDCELPGASLTVIQQCVDVVVAHGLLLGH